MKNQSRIHTVTQKKCSVCGKFVSFKEINEGSVKVEFTADTHFTTEKTEYSHRDCINKRNPL